MTTSRARSIALIAIAGALPTITAFRVNTTVMTQQPAAKWAICGAGEYQFSAAGQALGKESFDITCQPDGSYRATARTQLTPLGLDLTTKLEVGKDLLPQSVDVKGTANGQPFDQTAKFSNGSATLTANGAAQTVSYPPTASWLGGNIFFSNVFIGARYDEAKGGAQEIAMFPQGSLMVERLKSDTVKLGNETASFDRFVIKVGGPEIMLWRDGQRRLAVIGVPAQRFAAARAESARWADALLSAPAAAAPAKPAGPASDAIDYSAPADAPFTAEEVRIPLATYELAGTLLVPKAGKRPYRAAVMITGSGLQTRDSRIPGLEGYAPFRQIAERLASNGVAVLRMDDRGAGSSTGRETLDKVTTTLLAEDTRAQVAWLRKRTDIDPGGITLIGHSEGAAIAAMIAVGDAKVRSIVMMAGMGKSGAEVSLEQQEDALRYDTTMTADAKDKARAMQKEVVKTILAGGSVPSIPANAQAWVREYFAYDPLAPMRQIKQPILILQGERDRQVDQSHATLLADAARGAGNKQVKLIVFPTLNHLFVPSKTGSFTEYSRLETTVVPKTVLDAIAEWMAVAN